MIILYPGYSFETLASDCSAEDAEQLLAYWSAVFHPAILEKYNEIPRWESASMPPYSASEQPVCVPPCCESYLNDDWIQQREAEGTLIVKGFTSRDSITEKLLQLAERQTADGRQQTTEELTAGFDDEYIADFHSLAVVYFLTDLLVRQLHYMSTMDDSQCATAVFDSLKEYRKGNRESANDYLRQAFEAVCQSKEYFYPLHSYFIDLMLVPHTADGMRQAEEDGRNILTDNLVQQPLQLLPLLDAAEIILKRCRLNPADIKPTVFSSLHNCFTTFLPQLLKLAGYKSVILFAPLDGWQTDEKVQSKILWQGSDGTKIDALVRYPLDASADASFFTLAEKLGETINNDTTPTAVFARFSSQYNSSKSFWADDLLRMSKFTDNLGEFVSLEKYFEETANSGIVKKFGIDTFQVKPPFDVLSEDVQNNTVNPVSKWNEVWKNCTLRNVQSAFEMVSALLGITAGNEGDRQLTETFAKMLTADKNGNAGVLVFNPWSIPRRVFLSDEFIVDVPPLGYAFIAKPRLAAAPAVCQKKSSIFNIFTRPKKNETDTLICLVKNIVKGKDGKEETQNVYLLQNEFFKVKIDAATGILRSLFTDKSRYNQLSQQISFRLGNNKYTDSIADNITIEQPEGITGRLKIQGRLICSDNTSVAEYVEMVIIRRKSRLIEFHLHLEPKIEFGDNPWNSYFAVRRAWNDTALELRAGIADGLEIVNTDRILAPRIVDLRNKEKEQSLTFLTEGLPFHRLIGSHQLDTLLAVKGETVFDFRYGVGVDMKFPIPAAMEFLAPKAELICEVENAPQNVSSWMFCVEAKNVIALNWKVFFDETTGKPAGFCVSLLETENRRAHFELKTFLELVRAAATDLSGNELKELKTHNGSVLIDMHGRELLLIKVWIQ